jgi:hypothetical protein
VSTTHATALEDLRRPDDVDRRIWLAMDERQRRLAVSEDMRPEGISASRWNAETGTYRATEGMLAKTEEWDFRGSLSDMRPIGMEREDLAILARIMSRLSEHETIALVKRGYLAMGPSA